MLKLFQNKSLLKSIQIFLVCLVVLGGSLAKNEIVEADCANVNQNSGSCSFGSKDYTLTFKQSCYSTGDRVACIGGTNDVTKDVRVCDYKSDTMPSASGSDRVLSISNPGGECTSTDTDGNSIVSDGEIINCLLLYFDIGEEALYPCPVFASWIDCSIPSNNCCKLTKTIGVCPPPTCTLTATPNPIDLGSSIDLDWSSTNADSVVSSNFGAANVNGSDVLTPAAAITYTLTVTNIAGDTDTCSATVGVIISPSCKKGLIPCGRRCDVDPAITSYDESQPCTICHLILMMQLIMDFLFKIAAVIAAFFIAASGTMYIVSSGRPELLSLSKTIFKTTLLGFGLIFIAWILVNTILTMFGYIDPLESNEWHIMC